VNCQMLAIINDPDGYTNIRKGPSSKYEIVGRIKENEIFIVDALKHNWYHVYVGEDETLEGFIHIAHISLLDKLQKIGEHKLTTDRIVIEDSNIQFLIRQGAFKKSQHKYELEDGKYVVKIDGTNPYGVDGSFPSTQIIELNLSIGGFTIDIPSNAYLDLYNINYNNIEIRKGIDGTLFVVLANNSDGAGAYNAVWIFKDRKYLSRFVSRI